MYTKSQLGSYFHTWGTQFSVLVNAAELNKTLSFVSNMMVFMHKYGFQ